MFLLIFFSLVFLYSKISRRKVEIIAPTIFFFIMMVLYFSGVIFSSFIYGNVFIILLSIGALVYLIYDTYLFTVDTIWFGVDSGYAFLNRLTEYKASQ